MTRNLPLVLFATVALLTISHAYAQPANDSGTTRPLYTAKQRVVYTDGNSSRLMRGDPEEHASRYVNTALPVLLQEGWRISSVTPASNGSSHEGKTIVVLEIEAFPYDRTITVFEGGQETFPDTGIGVRIERQKQGRGPGMVTNPVPGRDTRDTFQLHITGDGTCKHMTPDELRRPRKLDVGYFIQIVGETTDNELQGFKFRLCTDANRMEPIHKHQVPAERLPDPKRRH